MRYATEMKVSTVYARYGTRLFVCIERRENHPHRNRNHNNNNNNNKNTSKRMYLSRRDEE